MAATSMPLPKGDHNGLAAIEQKLIDDPKKQHVCVVIIDSKETKTKHDTDEQFAAPRVRRVEVITDPQDMKRLRRLLEREYERRTGKVVLPLDLEEEMRGIGPRVSRETDEQAEADEPPPATFSDSDDDQ